MIRLRCGG